MFKSILRISHVKGKKWELTAPLVYSNEDYNITVPTGFKTDLTTGYYENTWTPASVMHDYALKNLSYVSRADADRFMRSIMKELKVDKFNYTIISIGLFIGFLADKIRGYFK